MSGQGRASFASLGMHAGTEARVRCSTYPDQGPILGLDLGPVSLTLSIAGREVPGWGVEFARELARQVQQFAEECERIHTAQQSELSGEAQGAGAKDAAA